MITKTFDSDKNDDFTELSHLILPVTDVLASHVGTPSCIEIKSFNAKCIDLGIAAQVRDIIEHSDHLSDYSWPNLCPLNHTLHYKVNAAIYMFITWGIEGFWYGSLQHFYMIKCMIGVTHTKILQVSFED